jgi:hypothetical protein
MCAPCGIDFREIQEEREEIGSETSREHAEEIPDPHPPRSKKFKGRSPVPSAGSIKEPHTHNYPISILPSLLLQYFLAIKFQWGTGSKKFP